MSALLASLLFAVPAFGAPAAQPSPAVPQKSTAARASTSPARQSPVAATVTFRNGELTVQARNSELPQILQAISRKTGMKIQGSPGSHRVFGVYGPAPPRQVLSQLLSGFNFNYLLVGQSPAGAPEKLILAGTAPTGPAPSSQPVHSVQPAPQSNPPRGQYHPSPFYQPKPHRSSPHAQPKRHASHKAQAPRRPRTPQEILKELEAMHAKQKQGSSH